MFSSFVFYLFRLSISVSNYFENNDTLSAHVTDAHMSSYNISFLTFLKNYLISWRERKRERKSVCVIRKMEHDYVPGTNLVIFIIANINIKYIKEK
ncbi:hypothetical protein PUN28_014038 [Cardiocondyla obscurior]|uniref:Secreted protein n=1 Tax=Cardiocondyla obscurior TaxID=286306 RepID=A0AAW2F451_9HYME